MEYTTKPHALAPSAGVASPMMSLDRCLVCRAKIVVRGSGDVIIRNAILRVEVATGRVSAKCSKCKSWMEVPLRFVG